MTQRGELEEFVAETIIQIAAGIRGAQGVVSSIGGQINPTSSSARPDFGDMRSVETRDDRWSYLQSVKFDVAVTREVGESGSGGGGLHVVGLSLGGKVEGSTSTVNASRIQFTIPVLFPGDFDEENEASLKRRREDDDAKMRQAIQNWRAV